MLTIGKTGLIGLLSLLILTTTAPIAIAAPAKQNAALDATITRIFAPYKIKDNAKAVWDQPFFSAATRMLITQWKRSTPNDEVTDLSGGDWICQCQDWDFAGFKVTKKRYKSLSPTKVEAMVDIDLGWGENRTTTLLLVREKGRWEIDDVITPSSPKGVKSQMRTEIAESKMR